MTLSINPASSVMPSVGVPPQPVFNARLAVGLLGILLAAMVAGLNGRIPGLVLADLRGGLGVGIDDASWLTTAYSAGELAAMPFATWFSITFSLRRFHLTMLFATLTLSAVIPWIQDLQLLLVLRALHGLMGGALIPLLMMSCLRFMPTSIRLHGLALFALVATFSPNIALWLASLWVDGLEDWRWVYWHVIPAGLMAAVLVAWGIPKMPVALPRLKQANWLGMSLGMPGLMLLVVGVDQGVRLDWFHAPLIVAALFTGTVLTALFLTSEWCHPAPFNRLQLLARRNIWLGLICFAFLLISMAAGVTLSANVLANLHGFRMSQSAPIGLIVGVPQLVLGSCVAMLLYQRWVDARHVFVLGLVFMSAACWSASSITDEWMVQQFLPASVLHAIGQPLAMVSLLFLLSSAVQPVEGPSFAGLVNIVRVFSATIGSAFIGQFMAVRGRFHSEMLIDSAGHILPRLPSSIPGLESLARSIAQQANVLAAADTYDIFVILALLLIPFVLRLQYIPAPIVTRCPSVIPPTTVGVTS